jgi:hypothetical protein
MILGTLANNTLQGLIHINPMIHMFLKHARIYSSLAISQSSRLPPLKATFLFV